MVYYGTETGTSKRYAETLVEILSYQYHAHVKNISECNLDVLKKSEFNGRKKKAF